MTLLTLCPDSNTSNTRSDSDAQTFGSEKNAGETHSKYLP